MIFFTYHDIQLTMTHVNYRFPKRLFRQYGKAYLKQLI